MLTIVGTTGLGALALDAGVPAASASSASAPAKGAYDPVSSIAVSALADLRAYQASQDPAQLAQYGILRDGIATTIAARLQVAPAQMIAAWQSADLTHQMALMAAFTQLGVPYHSIMSRAGEGFDCSGLTTYAWGQAGTTLKRQSGAQIKAASARTQDTAMAGDLVYYPGHVMMYLGVPDTIVHAPYTGRNVEVDFAPKKHSLRFGNPLG